MDAVGVIKENMNVERILNHYGVDFQYYGEFIRSACPIHKGDNPTAFVVNEEFLWACHTNSECGVGDVFTFVEKMEDVLFPQAVKIVAQILEIDIDNLIIAERKNDYLKEVERFMKYIKSKRRTKKVIEEYTPNAEMSSVKSFRNFNEETLILSKYNSKFISAIPTVLTGFGPLFTFLNIAIAFGKIDFSTQERTISSVAGLMSSPLPVVLQV